MTTVTVTEEDEPGDIVGVVAGAAAQEAATATETAQEAITVSEQAVEQAQTAQNVAAGAVDAAFDARAASTATNDRLDALSRLLEERLPAAPPPPEDPPPGTDALGVEAPDDLEPEKVTEPVPDEPEKPHKGDDAEPSYGSRRWFGKR